MDSEDHSVQLSPGADPQLNMDRHKASATCLGSIFQCLTTLLVKKFVLITE